MIDRPPLALRVGITGGRTILPEHESRACNQIAEILLLARQEIACLARMTEAKQAYRTDPTRKITPSFRFLSPLAEGADRLAARIAHAQGYALAVPMPFHRTDYEWDFKQKESLDEFRMMLAWAGDDTLELDGARDAPETDRYDEARSYEAVGRFLVRNCDLLIAVWDGKPGKGRGGTADIVQFAAEFGPPVCWIRADRDVAPIWIADTADLRDAKPQPAAANHALSAYLERLILPPKPPSDHEHRRSPIHRAAHIARPPPQPLAAFFAETPLPPHCWAQANAKLLQLAACGYRQDWHEPPPPNDHPAAMFWHTAYQPPDSRAGEYAARYRSTYVWVFALAALALIFAAVALAVPGLEQHWHRLKDDNWQTVKTVATAAELAALLLILWLVIVNIRREFHPRSIDYRLLAELYRKQQALALLGWSLSGRAVQALVEQHADGTPPERAAWIIWLFAAMSRAAPMLRARFDPDRCERVRAIVLPNLLDEQADYHLGRLTLCERAGHGFVAAGTLLFLLVIAVVVAKLVLLGGGYAPWLNSPLGLAATVLPALTAAAIGIRAYAELELLADQSRRMKAAMERARQRIARLDLTRPLASQDLGTEVLEVATRMLQDTDGWARLFRVKPVETS